MPPTPMTAHSGRGTVRISCLLELLAEDIGRPHVELGGPAELWLMRSDGSDQRKLADFWVYGDDRNGYLNWWLSFDWYRGPVLYPR